MLWFFVALFAASGAVNAWLSYELIRTKARVWVLSERNRRYEG